MTPRRVGYSIVSAAENMITAAMQAAALSSCFGAVRLERETRASLSFSRGSKFNSHQLLVSFRFSPLWHRPTCWHWCSIGDVRGDIGDRRLEHKFGIGPTGRCCQSARLRPVPITRRCSVCSLVVLVEGLLAPRSGQIAAVGRFGHHQPLTLEIAPNLRRFRTTERSLIAHDVRPPAI